MMYYPSNVFGEKQQNYSIHTFENLFTHSLRHTLTNVYIHTVVKGRSLIIGTNGISGTGETFEITTYRVALFLRKMMPYFLYSSKQHLSCDFTKNILARTYTAKIQLYSSPE